MKFFILIFLFICTCFIRAEAADTLKVSKGELIKIDSIRISGNEVTKEFVIKRELTFSEGNEISAADIDYNKERIYSLGLFNKVEIFIVKERDTVFADVIVEETWYIFPLPFLENKGADFKKLRVGVFLLYKNFRGRNETIASKIGFGYDPFYSVTFNSPLLFEGSDLQFQTGLVNMKVSNKSDYIKAKLREQGKGNFDYKLITGFVNVGKRLNKFNRLFFNVKYSYIEMPLKMENLTFSDTRIDRVFSSGVQYEFDSRDLIQNSTNGVYLAGSFTHSGFNSKNISVNSFSVDFRHYYQFNSQFYAKYRLYSQNIYGDNIPRYSYSFLGEKEFVRGHKNDQREAKNMLFGSFELNYLLLKEWNFSFKLPLIPQKLTSYRVGLVAKLFADAGTVFNSYKKLHFNGFDSGYGGGIMLLILPHNAFRFEYAVNKYGKGEFIFGSGFSF